MWCVMHAGQEALALAEASKPPKPKPKKDFSLISFGEEAEDEEESLIKAKVAILD